MTMQWRLINSRHEQADNRFAHASSLFFSAVKELAAFFTAVDVLFGAEQARKSANHWIEELELMDWPSDESMPNWRQATLGASARLGLALQQTTKS